MTEKQIQNSILKAFATRSDMRLWRNNTGVAITPDGAQVVRYGLPGSADLTGILPDGKRLEIEVKSATGRATGQQGAFARMIERFNGVYILARSVDDVACELRARGYM